MEINIISAQGLFKLEAVKRLTIPTLNGQRTLLNKHSDTIIALGFGSGSLKVTDVKEKFVLSGGIASLTNNVLTLIPEHFTFSKHSSYKYSSSETFSAIPEFETLLEKLNETN